MPYPYSHILVRFLGTFGDTAATVAESWSCGLRVNVARTSVTESEKVAFATALKTPATTFHGDGYVSAGPMAFLQAIAVAFIGTDGLYVGGASQPTTVVPLTPPKQGAAGNQHSWDVARAYTLGTTLTRGRASKGRFYWPVSDSVDVDGRYTVTKATNAATAAKAFLDAINAAAKSTWAGAQGLVVLSDLGAGVSGPVDRVMVGRAPDTQRRRTKSLVEDYQTKPLAAAFALAEDNIDRRYE